MAPPSSRRRYDGRVSRLQSILRRSSNPDHDIAVLRKQADPSLLLPLVHTLNDLPALRSYGLGVPIADKRSELTPAAIRRSLDFEDELLWSACELRVYSRQISSFVAFERQVSAMLLAADYAAAGRVLEIASVNFGNSLWFVENQIAVLEHTHGFTAQKAFAAEWANDRETDSMVRAFVQYYSFRAEKTVSPDRYQAALRKSFPFVFEEPGAIGEYIGFKLCFFGDLRFRDLASIIRYDRGCSIFDRYLTFIRVAQLIVADPELRDYLPSLRKSLGIVGKRFDIDARVLNIKHVIAQDFRMEVPPPSERFVRLSDLYTSGKYADCIDEFSLSDDVSGDLDRYELVAKAAARTTATSLDKISPQRRLMLDRMRDVLLKNERSAEAYQDLLKYAFTYQSTGWAAQLFAFLMREFRHESCRLPPGCTTMGDLNGMTYNPRLAFVFIRPAEGIAYLRYISRQCRDESLTCELIESILRRDPHSIAQLRAEGLPDSRIQKYLGKLHGDLGNYTAAIEFFEQLSVATDVLDVQDGIDGLIRCYLELGRIEDAVHALADAIIDRQNLRVRLPIGDVLAKAEENDNRYLFRNMALPILYEIYSRVVRRERKITRSAAYEEFLGSRGARRPTELSEIRSGCPRKQLVHFLRYVCVPTIMDSSVEFNSSEEIELERISICQILTDLDAANAETYLDEVKERTQRLVVNRGLRLVEQSKIYVDVEGIRTATDTELRDNFNRYKEFLSIPDSAGGPEQIFEAVKLSLQDKEDQGSPLTLLLPGNSRNETFRNFFLVLRDAFVSNNEHGLDGYLSVGIRHGTLSGQIRSPLERAKLITQRDEFGKYKPNEHWERLLAEDDWNERSIKSVILALDTLSQRADQLIDRIKNTDLQIRTESKSPDGLFDFRARMEDILPLRKAISDHTPFDEACDLVIEKLWKMTDAALSNIRCRIGEYKRDFGALLDQLQQAVKSVRGRSRSSDLDDAIAQCRTALQNELDKMAAWFRRTAITDLQDFWIDLPIDIAIQVINSINPNRQIYPLKGFTGSKKISGKALKAFVDIFFILFDNALKHSNLGDRAPDISIQCRSKDGSLSFIVANEVARVADVRLYTERLNAIGRDLGRQQSKSLVSKEGGTGLHKIYKILSVDLNCAFRMHVDLEGADKFVFKAEIQPAEFLL